MATLRLGDHVVFRRLKLFGLIAVIFSSLFFQACVGGGEKEELSNQVQKIPDWESKILLGMRQNYLKGKFTESWRIAQLGRVTNTPIEDLDYYLALAASKSGACPIGIYNPKSWIGDLLSAYGYRYRTRYRGASAAQSPYAKTNSKDLASQLEINKNFYLRDIPKAKIIKRSGCAFSKGKLDDRNTSETREFLHLLTWYHKFKDLPEFEKPSGYRNIIYRLFILAEDYGDEGDLELFTEYFKGFQDQDWIETSEPERTLLWDMISEIDESKSIPLKLNHPLEKLVEKIIFKSSYPEATNWLGSVEFNSFEPKRQMEILNHLLSIEDIEDKNWLLNQKMILLYKLGKVSETLNIIRTLTIDGESEDDQVINENAITIASELFSEFRYDKKLLGTIQSSLPSTYWIRIYRNMMFHHAMAGNKNGFNSILSSLKKNGSLKRLRLKKAQLDLLESLTYRRKNKFKKTLAKSSKTHWTRKDVLRLFDELSGEIFLLSENKKKTLTPFLQLMAEYAFENMKRETDLKKLEFLLSLLDKNKKIDWNIGSQATRKGSQNIGVVNLANSKIKESDFDWEGGYSLPKRDLLLIPDQVKGKGWVIR